MVTIYMTRQGKKEIYLQHVNADEAVDFLTALGGIYVDYDGKKYKLSIEREQ